MSTLLNTVNWDHSDMSQDIILRAYYNIDSRSGSNITVTVEATATLGGTVSYWGYDMYCNIVVNGQPSGEITLRNSSPSMRSGDSVSTSHQFSFNVGTGSGTLPVSIHFYSKSDKNPCGQNGESVSGLIEYNSTNTAPTTPASISPSSGYYNSSIPVSWAASSDNEGNAIHYVLQVSKNGNSWTNVSTNVTSTSYSYDISGDDEGTKYQFSVQAIDSYGLGSGWKTTSGFIYKNYTPIAPTTLTPTSGIYDASIPIAWSGASDPDEHTIHYILKVEINGIWSTLISEASNYTGTSYNYNISAHAEGTKYRFAVEAVDSLGLVSTTKYSSASATVSKNRSPIATTSVWTNESFAQTSTTVKWNSASDPDGQAITYELKVYKNSSYLTTITTSGTSYSYTFPDGTPCNTIFTFGVITVDTFNYKSSETKGGSCIKKLPPTAPQIVAPIASSSVFDKKPRIMIKINSDPNSDGQTLYVTWKGVEYNSVSNPTWFSSTGNSLVSGNTIIFKPQIDGTISSTTISIRSNNGYYYSTSNSVTFNITDSNISSITVGQTIIIPTHILETRSAINALLQAYGQSNYTFTVDVSNSKFITLTELTEMQNKLSSLITLLNNYDSTNSKFDKSTAFTTSDIFINSKYIDEIQSKLIDL